MNSRVVLILSLLGLMSFAAANQNMNRKQYRTIESYMNASADPCTDFYQYACGNWETIHSNESYTDSFEFVDYQIDEEYGHILKTRRKTLNRQKRFVRQVISYYRSCTSVEEFQPTLYIDWMRENENITWPDIEENIHDNTSKYDWLYMLATLRKYDLNSIFLTETLLQKHNDSRRFLIDIDSPANDDEFEPLKYWQFKVIMEYLGVQKRRKQRQYWNTFTKFETKILELYSIEDSIGFQEVKLTKIKSSQLVRYLKIVLEVNSLDENMRITITNLPYIQALFEFLKNYDEEYICRYLMIRFLWHLNYNGPTGFEKIQCISNVRQQMPLAMTWLYEQHNPILLEETEHIKNIFENIRAHFLKQLNENPNNFDIEILTFLNEKLKNMQLKIGNLPRNATTEIIDEFYHDLTLSESDFYANHLKLLRFNARKHHGRLSTILPMNPQDFYDLEDTDMAASSTPYFLQQNNLVIMPLTLLHLPMYHTQLHNIFKYSLVGFLLAHEITHGFDDSGLDYDQYGNMKETSEYIKENRKFDNNFDCLLTKNPHVIDEKIADVSGLRWAYETYFSNATEHEVLSWSKMPQAQLFFRNFALFFCGALSNDEILANSSHGTWRSRLHDTVSQFPKFGQAYDCPVGSPMNPKRKCQLWR